jgi:hypothetical protein
MHVSANLTLQTAHNAGLIPGYVKPVSVLQNIISFNIKKCLDGAQLFYRWSQMLAVASYLGLENVAVLPSDYVEHYGPWKHRCPLSSIYKMLQRATYPV